MSRWSRFVFLSFVASATIAVVSLDSAARAAEATAKKPAAEQARSATDFLDSVGVCTHLGRTQTNYVKKFPEVAKLLLDSGIRHVRTDPITSPEAIANAKKLGAEGVRFDIIIHPDGADQHGHSDDKATIAALLKVVKNELAEYTEIIEALNEPDGQPEKTRAWMKELQHVCKQDPVLKTIPLLGSALANPKASAKRHGDCSKLTDIGNIHAYPGGRAPEISLPEYVGFVQPQYPGMKYMITETGYHSALNNPPNRHRPTAQHVEAIYMPRLFLDYFKNGIVRSYKYQFLDDRTDEEADAKHQPVQEAHFGLVDYNLKPKPSYMAVKNLMTILADEKAEGFQPQSLKYAVNGPDDLRSLLLQKSDGDFYLAVWRAVPIWDMNKRVDLPVDAKSAAVTLTAPAKQVRLYHPSESAEAYETLSDATSIPLSLKGEVVILEISDK